MADELFIPCTPKGLEPEAQVLAAQRAVEINPANAPNIEQVGLGLAGIVLPPAHLAVLTSKYWGSKGARLTTGFTEPVSVELRNKILLYLNQWDQFCNAQFVYSTTDPMVRITLELSGYWSYVGTDILYIPKNQPTMCLQKFHLNMPEREWLRVIPHEGGHSLGFPHEHSRRAIIQRLDRERTIGFFRTTQGWTAQMVVQQILTPLEESSLIGTPTAEDDSIMTYSFPAEITVDNRPIVGGLRITKSDGEFSAKIYPETVVPKPEPPVESELFRQSFDHKNKIMRVHLPSGWEVKKMSPELVGGLDMSELLCQMADELESALPAAAPGAGPILGLFQEVQNLIAALKAGDVTAAMRSVRNILNVFLGEGEEGISFVPYDVAAAGVNLELLKSLLKRLWPILLDELLKKA